jgi:tetratricopeptide (TPR) repeat protein
VFFYWGHRQYDEALVEFNRTLELQPNNASARQFCGWVYRRRGEWERSIADVRRAQELDPRDAQIPANLGATYAMLRQWKDAEEVGIHALSIDPHNVIAASILAMARLGGPGDVDSALRAFDGIPVGYLSGPQSFQGDVTPIIGMRVYLYAIERRFSEAFQAFEQEGNYSGLGHLQQLSGRAALRVLAGQTEAAKSAGEEALPLLEARLRESAEDTFAMTELSWVYLALGRKSDALRLAQQAADLIPVERDAISGIFFQAGLAQIEARADAAEEAVKRLRHLLSIPAGQRISIARLKIDPVWDPIRTRPDFQQLLSGPEQIGPKR